MRGRTVGLALSVSVAIASAGCSGDDGGAASPSSTSAARAGAASTGPAVDVTDGNVVVTELGDERRSFRIRSCERSGPTGVIVRAIEPDDPSQVLVIDAPDGSGRLTYPAGDALPVEMEVELVQLSHEQRSDLRERFALGAEPAVGTLMTTSRGPRVYVAC